MKTLIILVVVIAIVKIGSASADDQNKQLATTNNQIPALTNHEVRLKAGQCKVLGLKARVKRRFSISTGRLEGPGRSIGW